MGYSVKILADSVSPAGKRLTTWELTYPRFVHAELMTHRLFCLAGDAVLEFDLPAGQGNGTRRVYRMTIAEFVGKWLHGSRPHRSRWGTERTYDLKSRLSGMRVRQLNEATGSIETSTITGAFESGMKPVYEIGAGKYKIAGSVDHRVLTGDGWKTIGDIRVGDDLVVCTRNKPDELCVDSLRLKKINGRWRSVWQRKQRERLQAEDGLCRECRQAAGVEIHHKVPVYQDPSLAFVEDNVTLVCDVCHDKNHGTQGWQTGVLLYAGQVTIDVIRYRGVEPTYDLSIAGAFPNFLANRVVVHNSRNSASSRAIPNEKLRQRVQDDPALPVWWGKNQSGMQAREELPDDDAREIAGIPFPSTREIVKRKWLGARDAMLRASEDLAELGLHKQLCNRLIEPWMFITVIVSATEFDNWFHLRDHPDAQPEIARVARMMHEVYRTNAPQEVPVGAWHLPLIGEEDVQEALNRADVTPHTPANVQSVALEILRKVSVGRCARVSYLTHDGKRDLTEDVRLHDRLIAGMSTGDPLHMSPFEHVAQALATPEPSGNFRGWRQYRKTFAAEHYGGRMP